MIRLGQVDHWKVTEIHRLKLTILCAAATLILLAALAVPATAAYPSTAAFLDAEILRPHNSPIRGSDMTYVWKTYGVGILQQLVILGAETSVGDPKLGGRLVSYNNFGCIGAFGDWKSKPWGVWANGTVRVAGKTWLTWPDATIGMMSWGRYIKVGADRRYLPILNRYDWRAFAAVYYGSKVPGFEDYVANLYGLERSFRAKAARAGFVW